MHIKDFKYKKPTPLVACFPINGHVILLQTMQLYTLHMPYIEFEGRRM